MASLTLRNVPEALHARLKESAEKNGRSPSREFVTRLPWADHSKVRRYKRHSRA